MGPGLGRKQHRRRVAETLVELKVVGRCERPRPLRHLDSKSRGPVRHHRFLPFPSAQPAHQRAAVECLANRPSTSTHTTVPGGMTRGGPAAADGSEILQRRDEFRKAGIAGRLTAKSRRKGGGHSPCSGDDVDLGRRQLTVARSEWKGHVTTPKGGKTRYVSLTGRLADVLTAGPPSARAAGAARSGGGVADDEGRQGIGRRVAASRRGAGIHILRHTFCSHLAMRGVPARAIQELAGHGRLATTLRYMHLSPAALDGRDRALGRRHVVEESWRRRELTNRLDVHGRKWWRRRESNPRPKGLSPQNSTCLSVLDGSRPATKNGECAGH